MRGAATLALALAAALAGGCDGGGPPRPSALAVSVTGRDDGAPQAGVKLMIMDAAANRPVAGPLVTGPDGRAAAPVPGSGRLQVLCYPGGGRGVWIPPPPIAPADSGGGCGWRGVVGDAGPETLRVTIVTAPLPGGEPLARIAGTVRDAATGAPLPGAFVGTPAAPYLDDYAGLAAVREDVADGQGRFRVADIPFALDPETGRALQVLPLLVTREGYDPVAWVWEPPPGDDNLDIAGAVIALQPAGPTGVIKGRVVFGTEPVAGARVAAGFYAPPPPARAGGGAPPAAATLGALLPGCSALTGPDGRFALAGVPPGFHVVHPGYQAADGWTVAGSARAVRVVAGEQTEAGDFAVARTIEPVQPPAGGVLAGPRPALAWTAVAEADSYAVYLDGRLRGVTTVPVWRPLPPDSLAVGRHVLQAVAFTAADRVVGAMEYGIFFRVVPPAGGP